MSYRNNSDRQIFEIFPLNSVMLRLEGIDLWFFLWYGSNIIEFPNPTFFPYFLHLRIESRTLLGIVFSCIVKDSFLFST